jgi:hypothetical protein
LCAATQSSLPTCDARHAPPPSLSLSHTCIHIHQRPQAHTHTHTHTHSLSLSLSLSLCLLLSRPALCLSLSLTLALSVCGCRTPDAVLQQASPNVSGTGMPHNRSPSPSFLDAAPDPDGSASRAQQTAIMASLQSGLMKQVQELQSEYHTVLRALSETRQQLERFQSATQRLVAIVARQQGPRSHTHTRTHTYLYMHMHTHAHTHLYMHIHTHALFLFVSVGRGVVMLLAHVSGLTTLLCVRAPLSLSLCRVVGSQLSDV